MNRPLFTWLIYKRPSFRDSGSCNFSYLHIYVILMFLYFKTFSIIIVGLRYESSSNILLEDLPYKYIRRAVYMNRSTFNDVDIQMYE